MVIHCLRCDYLAASHVARSGLTRLSPPPVRDGPATLRQPSSHRTAVAPPKNPAALPRRAHRGLAFVAAVDAAAALLLSPDKRVRFCWRSNGQIFLKRHVNMANRNMVGAGDGRPTTRRSRIDSRVGHARGGVSTTLSPPTDVSTAFLHRPGPQEPCSSPTTVCGASSASQPLCRHGRRSADR